MKKSLCRAFSILLIMVLLVSSIGFSFATGSVVEYVAGTFFDVVAGELVSEGVSLVKDYVKDHIGYSAGAVCKSSLDGYHHCDSAGFGPGTHGSDENGRYSLVKCKYCGESFKYYSSFSKGSGFGKSDLQQSYDAQVQEMPATGYTSTGRLIWQPTIADVDYFYRSSKRICYISSLPCTVDGDGTLSVYSNTSIRCIDVSTTANTIDQTWIFYFLAPITGLYSRTDSIATRTVYSPYDGGICNIETFHSTTGFMYYSSGKSFAASSDPNFPKGVSRIYSSTIFEFPVYELIPDSALFENIGGIYDINSRPTSITGDYGIIGDNGQIIKVEGDKIVNETNNTYYNPATGTTDTITDWSYNYENRSYTLTLGGGTTTTVTYGDENVVIKEGDTTYNIYYLVDGSGSENPGPDIPSGCDHTWTETSRTDPTCTTAGKIISQCSECGQTKTEPLPATGHTWVVDRTVQTTYDEEGNLLQQGYTIYSCSVCGEQYKDMEGVGPPGDEEEKSIWEKIGDLLGSGFGGIIEIIEAILSKILDALTSLIDMLLGKLKYIVESVLSIFDELPALFGGGFLDFLAAIFPFLPPEITTILTFGVIAITFIGILKAVRR